MALRITLTPSVFFAEKGTPRFELQTLLKPKQLLA
jgi:hypothetical protein